MEGGTSDARNSHIFNIFALVDIGERSGMGLADLYGHWKKYDLPEPCRASIWRALGGREVMKIFNTTVDTDVRDNTACDRCRNSEVRHTDADGLCANVRLFAQFHNQKMIVGYSFSV